jgi:hypothetical protein
MGDNNNLLLNYLWELIGDSIRSVFIRSPESQEIALIDEISAG